MPESSANITTSTPDTDISDFKDKRLISILQNNSSKVVNEKGEPLVVYHQTNSTRWINRETGEDWSLRDILSQAVKLVYDARNHGANHGDIVSVYARQGVLFADESVALGKLSREQADEALGKERFSAGRLSRAEVERKALRERDVKNVVLDSKRDNLPTTRKAAKLLLPEGGKPIHNEDQDVTIVVGKKSIKHSSLHDEEYLYKAYGKIDEIIENAVKIGELPVAEDEKGHTHSVSIFYVPINVDGVQYSARLVVKELENYGRILENLSLYNMAMHKEKTPLNTNLSATNNGAGVQSNGVSVYKVKDLIHSTQEKDKKLLGIGDNERMLFSGGVSETASRLTETGSAGASERTGRTGSTGSAEWRGDVDERDRAEVEARDREYAEAVERGDMETAQRMVDEAADRRLADFNRLNPDAGEKGFQYHRGEAPKRTVKRYAVFNVGDGGFRAAYAGNDSSTPVGVWLDSRNLKSFVSDMTFFDDGTPASYIQGDTGHGEGGKFSPTLREIMRRDPDYQKGKSYLLERGGKHGADIPNFRQMNLGQDEDGNPVKSPMVNGALPHNKLVFEIEYGIGEDGDLTERVKTEGRMMRGKNQGLAKIEPNQFYDFKTNANAAGNWSIGGTFRIVRLVPAEEIAAATEAYKKAGIAEANLAYRAGEISKKDHDARVRNMDGIKVQKWVGGYHPEDFGLSVEGVDRMFAEGKQKKLMDAATYDDDGRLIPLSERFNLEKEDMRFSGGRAEREEVERRAKADRTWMKSPDGSATEKSEREWVQEHLPGFKKWFGEWEKPYRIEKLRKSENASITGIEIVPSTDFTEYRKNALAYGKTLKGQYTNKDTGALIHLYSGKKNGGLHEILEHDYKTPEHLQSIAAIPEIIEKAIFIDSSENIDKEKHPNVTSYDYYVCGLKIGDVDFTVKMVVSNMEDGKRYYDHKLSQIEKGKLIDIVAKMPESSANITTSTPDTDISDFKDKRLISILQNNSSKVVNEKGEPLVVYHQTNSTRWINRETGEDWDKLDWSEKEKWENASQEEWEAAWEEQDFYEFDDRHARESVEVPGFFFSPVYDEHHEYGKRTIAAYLDMKNPAYDPDISGLGVTDHAGRELMERLIAEGYDGIIRTEDGKPYEYIVFRPEQIKSATENNGDFSGEKRDIRFSGGRAGFGYNRGYTEDESGNYLSLRGYEAEKEGKYVESKFRKVYELTKKSAEALKQMGLIVSNEWHHTGKGFNRNDFYEWGDHEEMDYTDGFAEPGSLGGRYTGNKKAIDRLAKEADEAEWAYEPLRDEVRIPTFDFFKAHVFDSGTTLDALLTEAEKANREARHAEISSNREMPSYERRELHESLDRSFTDMVRSRVSEEDLRALYESRYGEELRRNAEVAAYNAGVRERNAQTDGKERKLAEIATLMGVPEAEAERMVERASAAHHAEEAAERRRVERERIDNEISSIRGDVARQQDEMVKKLIAEGRAERVERVREKPDRFITEKEEMNGRYGWFDASFRYKLPRYYSGIEFKDERGFNDYNKIAADGESRIRELRDGGGSYEPAARNTATAQEGTAEGVRFSAGNGNYNSEFRENSSELFINLHNNKISDEHERNRAVTEISRRIGEGTARIVRMGEKVERGRRTLCHRAGSLLAALYDGRIAGKHAEVGETLQGGTVISERQERSGQASLHAENATRSWAKDNGFWVNENKIKRECEQIGSGAEGPVYRSKDGKKAIKFVHLDRSNQNPNPLLDCLDEIACENAALPIKMDVVGFAPDSNGRIKVVVEHPYIEGKTLSEYFGGDYRKADAKVDEFVQEKYGFEPVYSEDGDLLYHKKDGLAIGDLNYNNVIIDKNGDLHIIDSLVFLESDVDGIKQKGFVA